VHLVELSTHYEGLDNIVAFWNPVQKPKPFEPYRLAYTLMWSMDIDARLSPNQAVSTRVGLHPRDPKARQFVIDFNGLRLQALPDNTPPTAVVSCSSNGKITENQVFRVPQSRAWRVILKLEPGADNSDPIDLRCNLQQGSEMLSETWTYHWSPP
jgi:glucans biosynthesis protein